MGLTSDSEAENSSMKSKIDEMNMEPIVDHRNEDNCQIKNCTDSGNEAGEHSDDESKLNSLYKCTFAGCHKTFHKQSRLTWHRRQHTGERPYKCSFPNCDKSYTNSSHLKRHQQVHETVHESVVCGICQLTLKNRTNLLKHHRRFHETKSRIFCETCNVTFRKKYKYDEHMTRFHDGKLFKCKQCGREYKNLGKLRRHQKVHEIKYECPENDCEMTFENYLEFRAHAKTHPKEYVCDKCQRKFIYSYQFNRHLKSHEGKFLACPYECCPKTYTFTNQLRMHIRTKHEKSKLFECDECKRLFTFKDVLRRHILATHLGTQPSKPRIYKKDDERRERKDVFKQTRSMPSVLTGVFFSHEAEKMIINRDTKFKLSDTNFESEEAEHFVKYDDY